MTTNPTLMRKAGIEDYEAFAREVLETVRSKPISFEVFADDFEGMRRQALRMRNWQENVFVKIPIVNPRGESAVELIRSLSQDGVKVNVTAVLEISQVEAVAAVLAPCVPSVVSVFAGRIADTGRDPAPIVRATAGLLQHLPKAEVLWASVREVLNIYQASSAWAHIVTVPHDILRKALEMSGKNLATLTQETVQMFDRDAKAAGYSIDEGVAEPMQKAA
jgi:transaldolase